MLNWLRRLLRLEPMATRDDLARIRAECDAEAAIEDALFSEYCAQPDRPVELRMCRDTEVSEPRLTACVDMADWERNGSATKG